VQFQREEGRALLTYCVQIQRGCIVTTRRGTTLILTASEATEGARLSVVPFRDSNLLGLQPPGTVNPREHLLVMLLLKLTLIGKIIVDAWQTSFAIKQSN
jgi:hypothetical protein